MGITQRLAGRLGKFSDRLNMSIRTKLIFVFIAAMIIPLLIITVIAISQYQHLGGELYIRTDSLKVKAYDALTEMGIVAVDDAIQALDDSAIKQLERTSTDIAKQIADFLYDRDNDILYAAELEPGETAYRNFLTHKTRSLIRQNEWVLAADGKSWVPVNTPVKSDYSPSTNSQNATNYQNRPAEIWDKEERPLYLEMSFIDLAGNEIIKITNSEQMNPERRNISNRLNTYAKAETYFTELANLKAGEIYVSDVIGSYVPSRLIGMYNPDNTAAAGLDFNPEEEAFAGMENPNGKRFKGIIRWAAPVVRNGRISGYVTLALDHDHIMEFVDHITPMDDRYVEMPSAFEGNYAFIWDYLCRSIAHPRHHSIVGFDPETGEAQVPWLEDRIYNEWQESGLSYTEFIKDVPVFFEQARHKRPAPELTAMGLVGLDGRYLNNAPQCTGWFDLTREGGSGSFLILWSGIWKPNTAATIPYYTGNYGKTKRGFGFVAIGAGLEDFHRPARETEYALQEIITGTEFTLSGVISETGDLISSSIFTTVTGLSLFAVGMTLLAIFIAFLLALVFSNSITDLVQGIAVYRSGKRQFRFKTPVKDEIGNIADSFDEMADSLAIAESGYIVIIDNDKNIIYMNNMALTLVNLELDQAVGKPYTQTSVYPAGSVYDPISALLENRETEIYYLERSGKYLKGKAAYMFDKNGKNAGYIITTADVTGMMEQQKRLEDAVEEAKLANEHKGNFLARMSHEIRTPMNAIFGMTRIVKRKLGSGEIDREELRGTIDQIETSSHHLMSLLNDILDISKIEAGKIELFVEETDLQKLAETVETIIRPRCEEKHISFETEFDLLEGRSYPLDALRLRQVLINLLGNSVKFTPEFGTISFSIRRISTIGDKANLEFRVSDTGIGISKETIGTLFQPFRQADNQISAKYGGTGLGLAISKSIVQMFGGEISVKSDIGQGSVFSFNLLLEEKKTEIEEEKPVQNHEDRLKGKRALLVDDVEINRIVAISMLEATGIDVDEADDGSTALAAFEKSAENFYDIIFMDVQMPKMNGYEATAAIRALNRSDAKTIPIIALTANAFKDDIDKALESGMNAHLAKPMEIEKIIEVTFKQLKIGD